MRLARFLPAFTAAFISLQPFAAAQSPPLAPVPDSSGMPVISSPELLEGSPEFNGFSIYRAHPDLGAPGSAAHGFSHFMMPLDKYGTWYRPRAATLTQCQRCAPDDFRPRGLGHLFARPCDGYRMDYSPYTLNTGRSQYGPSYLARQPDPRCVDCDETRHH
ncbi:MAG: hypothetical protein KDA91_02995 [Planctomycetaceae bacterium]|nr:hypothetical protein [Planctomycetaceae bacterium]